MVASTAEGGGEVGKRYTFEEPLIDGVVLSRPNRFIMEVMVTGDDGAVHRCHCPNTGRIGGAVLSGAACLLSRPGDAGGRKTAYTVEALSFDQGSSWIGINQTAANGYIGFLLETGQLSGIVSGPVRREVRVGRSRLDFQVGDAFVEVKTPLIALPLAESVPRQPMARFNSFDRLIKHYSELSGSLASKRGKGKNKSKRRAIILMCYLYDAEPFRPPTVTRYNSRVLRAARKAEQRGVERWQVNLSIDRFGVGLVRYFRSVPFFGGPRRGAGGGTRARPSTR